MAEVGFRDSAYEESSQRDEVDASVAFIRNPIPRLVTCGRQDSDEFSESGLNERRKRSVSANR